MTLFVSKKPLQPKTARLLWWSANLLVLAGCGALAWCGVVLFQAYFYQNWAFNHLALAVKAEQNPVGWFVPPPMKGGLIGWIYIPRIGVSSAVLEGTDGPTLRLGVGHIEETSAPGALGNVVLAGHRDTFFRKLRQIHPGDEILLTTTYGNYKYAVDSTRVVGPDSIDVLSFLGRPTLTLVTCYPFDFVGPAPKRFIVQATRIDRWFAIDG